MCIFCMCICENVSVFNIKHTDGAFIVSGWMEKKNSCQGILFFTAPCSPFLSSSSSPIYLLTNQEYIQSSSIVGAILNQGYDGDPGISLSNKYLKYDWYHELLVLMKSTASEPMVIKENRQRKIDQGTDKCRLIFHPCLWIWIKNVNISRCRD